jgi:hypothetical protein
MRAPILIYLSLPLASVCLILAGCAGGADRAVRNSPEYRAGYSDGCVSANREGANKRDTSLARDEAAYRNSQAYHSGWGAGFGACRAMTAPVSPAGDPLAMPRTP